MLTVTFWLLQIVQHDEIITGNAGKAIAAFAIVDAMFGALTIVSAISGKGA